MRFSGSRFPYPQADHIMTLTRHYESGSSRRCHFPKFMAWREPMVRCHRALRLRRAADERGQRGAADPVQTCSTSRGFVYRSSESQPMVGRSFSTSEDIPHGPPVAVMCEAVLAVSLRRRSRHARGPVLSMAYRTRSSGIVPNTSTPIPTRTSGCRCRRTQTARTTALLERHGTVETGRRRARGPGAR